MNRIPFSAYDFFGFLASGFLLLVAVDYVGQERWLLRDDLGVVFGLFWTGVAYITGQILASPSAFLLEGIIVRRWLMPPSLNLFQNPPKVWWTNIFPGYYTPLPVAIRNRIREKAESDGIAEIGETLFVHVFGKVKADKDAMPRLNTFLNLYGFCRNISFACLLAALVILVGSLREGAWDKLPLALIAIVGSVGMFYRYLKFFRQYSYELFVTYAASSPKEPDRGD